MSRFVLTAQLQLQAPNNVAQVVRQIQNQLNNVTVNVQVQNSQRAQRQLQQVTQQTNQAASAAERMGRAFAVSVRRFAAFSVATRAVGLFTSTLSDAVQTAIDFERQLIKVSQVTGESLSKLSKLTNTITDLSTSLGVTSQDLLDVSTTLLQAGLSSKDTEIALKSLAKAALAPNFDSISETAEGAIAILAQFGQGVEALESQLGSINAVAGAFAVEASDLIDVIRRTGGVFKSSGGDLNELLALFTSVRATTRESAESIGTGLRTIFTRIQRPKTIEFLKQFGVELVDLNGKFVGPFEAVKRLSEALSGLGEGDITFIRIAEELGGFRQIGKVLPLLQQFSVAQQALNVANKSGNSLTQDAATAQQALAIRILKVREEFLALVRSITETSTFQIMANTALSLASALLKIGDAIKPLLPLLGALAAVKIAKGLGTFAGGLMGGFTSGRTFNKGGKVHYFARGGMVPGTGNRDTVPAMLQPGEFVIKKSSVNKLGAGNLAAMNENRFAVGGLASQNKAGMAIPDTFGDNNFKSSNVPVNLSDIANATPQSGPLKSGSLLSQFSFKNTKTVQANQPNVLPVTEFKQALQTAFGFASKTYAGKTAGVSSTQKTEFNRILTDQMQEAIKNGASQWSNSVGVPLSPNEVTFGEQFTLAPGLAGSFFESVVDAFQGRPIGVEASENKRPFDFITGLRGGANSRLFANLEDVDYIDAKKSASLATDSEYKKKIASQLAIDGYDEVRNAVQSTYSSLIKQLPAKKHFGGIIQKFAFGGIAKAPLIDDIINASGTVTPRPSSAIASLIRAGGGAIDIDRTIKRTIGDKAYGMAKTSGQQSAALDKYFRDPQARLRDVKSAPLTSFGKELQTAIKAGQLQPGKLSIISKSQRVPGVAEYLSQLFGIPLANMIFTQGGSKQPAMDALRNKGPRASRVARFATGGGVGTDTVPALLTPGEFVVNRSSAQRIGYGNLNRMNKVGRYAKGGVVQHFAAGTSGIGAKPIVSNIPVPGFDTKAPTLLNKTIAKITGSFTLLDVSITNANNEMMVLKKFAPQVYKSLALYANQTNLTVKEQVKLASAYNNIIATLLKQGATDQQIINSMQTYSTALNDAAANVKKQGATSASITTPPSRQPTPMGSPGSIPGMNNNTAAINANTKAQNSAAQSAAQVVANNKLFAASVTTSLIQGFLPAIDENSSGLLIFSQQVLSTIVLFSAVATGLEALGLSLSRNAIAGAIDGAISAFENLKSNGIFNTIQSLFAQTAATATQTAATAAQTTSVAVNTTAVNANTVSQQAQAAGSQKLAGALQAGAIATTLVSSGFYVLFGALKEAARLEKERAIKLGDVEGAGKAAAKEGGAGVRQTFATVGAVIGGIAGTIAGAIPGSIVPGAGTVAGGAAGGAGGAIAGGGAGLFIADMFGFTQAAADAARLEAEVSAMKVKTDKIMVESTSKASSAMEDFSKGTISAQEALRAGEQGALATSDFIKKTKETNVTAEKAASERFFGREGAQKKAQQEGQLRLQDAQKMSQEQLRTMMPAMQASMRSTAVTGGDFDDFISSLSDAQFEVLNFAEGGMENAYRSFVNLQKEVDKAKAAFEAMNLGLRGPTATATAMSASMEKFAAGLEVGGDTFTANVEFLTKAVSGAAQALDPDEIKSAVSSVRQELEQMGVSAKFADKFEANANAFAEAQQNYSSAFNNIINDMERRRQRGEVVDTSPEAVKDAFAKELTVGLGADAKKNLTSIIDSIELTPDEVQSILGGNLSIFGDKLGEAGKKQFEQIMQIAQERRKAEQTVISLINQRAESERNLAQAQKEAVDLYMEGRDVQARYGGKDVSAGEKRSAILAKANAGSDRAGLTALRTGSAAELRARNAQIVGGFKNIEARRKVQGGMEGTAGAEANVVQQNLQQAQKDQVQTIRELIKFQEDELKIIQEKNKLEKQSMESLISGDIEKFFEQQAAVGATAAIATGNETLMNQFGASALAGAYTDIQRQQEAGVRSIYGQQIGGAGGLAEQAAQAALRARGVQSQAAAQVMAGTTPEQEAIKASLRELGGLLGEAGLAGAEMAAMQVDTATFNVGEAQVILSNVEFKGREAAQAAGMYRGGTVYANRGIFVPRGTDTVPAMLTPGEFVVNRAAVQRGNNLQLLQAMNGGMNAVGYSRGGKVQYLRRGGRATEASSLPSIDPKLITDLSNALNGFNTELARNITNLQNTKFQIKLDTTNINVNINGTSFLATLRESIQKEFMGLVAGEISKYKVGSGGKLTKSDGVLNNYT